MNYCICYNLDKPQKHVKWKKPDTRDYVLYDSIQKLDAKLPGAKGVGWETGINSKWGWETFGDDGNVLKLFYGDGYTTW